MESGILGGGRSRDVARGWLGGRSWNDVSFGTDRADSLSACLAEGRSDRSAAFDPRSVVGVLGDFVVCYSESFLY